MKKKILFIIIIGIMLIAMSTFAVLLATGVLDGVYYKPVGN